MGPSLSPQAGGVRAWTLGELFARAGLRVSRPSPDIAIPGGLIAVQASPCESSRPNTGIAVSGLPDPVPEVAVLDIVDDSRAVTPGACFVAVPGAKADGREFIQDAIRREAAVVVHERAPVGAAESEGFGAKTTLVQVHDARQALARLSAAFHGLTGEGARAPKLVGVTGTNGKTTVTWMLRSIFRAAGAKAGLLGTVEYDSGTGACAAPLTTPGPVELCRHIAAAREAGVQFMSLEVSSHALDQKRTDGLDFAAAVFTNLTGDHLDYHGTKEAYFAAKRRLFERLAPSAVAVINADDATAGALRASTKARVIMYSVRERTLAPASGGVREGILVPADTVAPADILAPAGIAAVKNAPADVCVRGIEARRGGSRFTLCTPAGEISVHLPLVGEHNISNALAAAAAAGALGADLNAIRDGLENLGGVPGRLQRVEPEGCSFSVLVDYAHTDDALRNVLRAVRPITAGRIICVFGCGGNRDRSKRPRMAAAVEELADVAVVTSDNPRHEEPKAIIEEILRGFSGQGVGSSSLSQRVSKALTPALSQGERQKQPSPPAPLPRGEGGRCEIIVEVDRGEAIGRALREARAGDTVLIAGKGHEDYQLVGDRVLDFDDVAVARGFLESMNVEQPVSAERASGTADLAISQYGQASADAGRTLGRACEREVCA